MHEPSTTHAEPHADRPHIPGYGIPESEEGTLPWSFVTERLEKARNYWVGTVGKHGQPHAVPVWGMWFEGKLYFGAGPRTARNLAANPAVEVHLESGDEVVILQGTAEEFTEADPEFVTRWADAYGAKYEYRPDAPGGYVLQPRVAYAWHKFPADATRWRFGK